jgi:hypothetical protein
MELSHFTQELPIKTNLYDQVRQAIRVRRYSIPTEEAYLNLIKLFILFHNKSQPKQIGRWNQEEIVWELPYREVLALGLGSRIAKTEKD